MFYGWYVAVACGLMMCMSTVYYAWLAYKLAQRTGRNDVCALGRGRASPAGHIAAGPDRLLFVEEYLSRQGKAGLESPAAPSAGESGN